MAHHGHVLTNITEGEAAELLCAALFAFNYLRLVREHLTGVRPPLTPISSR
jgi:hypothetical protein